MANTFERREKKTSFPTSDMAALKARIAKLIGTMRRPVEFVIPYRLGNLLSLIHEKGQVLEEEYLAEGTRVKCLLDAATEERVRREMGRTG